MSESGRIIDHTAMEYLHQFQKESLHQKRSFELDGINHLHSFTSHLSPARMQDARLTQEKTHRTKRELDEPEVVLGWMSDVAALLVRAGRAPAIS